MIDALLGEPHDSSMAQVHSLGREALPSGVDDHELLVGVSQARGRGVMWFTDEKGSFSSVGESGRENEIVYLLVGYPYGFPGNAEVPLDVIRQSLKEFVLSGGVRPSVIKWVPHEFR
ncbi:Imm1 family immunity protein [Actinoplanes sp. NBRC 101535]|uniref:Imm1 family immunity protein n=1 Tax=Actinoplanes sp. NBRC 101535 TaxID=3032196 RepID=UPI0033391155